MRRLWSAAIVIVTAAFVLGVASPAVAKGSTFGFNGRWHTPGQVATGRTQFSDGVEEQGRVADGPYFAYLLRGERFIQPPRVPRSAVPLGRVRMRSLGRGLWEASVRFIVPDVRPGEYTISLCNAPCRSAYVGDLMGGWIAIAATAGEARVRNLEDRITARVSEQVSVTTSELYAQLEELRSAVDSVQSPSVTVGTELRLEPLEDQVKSMSAELRRLRERNDQGRIAWLWLAGWLVAGAIGAGWWRPRRRRVEPGGTDSSGRGGVEGSELEAITVPIHLDRVSIPDLS